MSYESNIDERRFFEGKPQALGLYEAFAERLFALFPDAGVRVQKTQITFTNPRVFACVSMLKVRPAKGRPAEYIVVTFGLGQQVLSPRIDAATEAHPGRWTHHVLLAVPGEIDGELMAWVQAAYAFSADKRRAGRGRR